MVNVFLGLAAAGAGWLLGTLGARRAIDEQIDRRMAELETKLGRGQGAGPVPASPVLPRTGPAGQPAPARNGPPPSVPVPTSAPVPPVEADDVSPEVLVVISAAICAFLGRPARIRRVRRIPGGVNPWAQVGRVSVMASHALNR